MGDRNYDNVGNRTVTISEAGHSTFTYDNANNMTRVEFTGSGMPTMVADLAYNEVNQVKNLTRYSDITRSTVVAYSTYLYDALNRLTLQDDRKGSDNSVLSSYLYSYDIASRITSQTVNGATNTFAYDTTNQLTGDGSTNFTYDATGNRNSGSYTTGTGNRTTNDGTWTYTYDDEGNLKTKSDSGANAVTWTYEYDNRNQLIKVERRKASDNTLQMRASYGYDSFGNRVRKRVDADGDGEYESDTRFYYDGWKTGSPQPYRGNENFDIYLDYDGSSSTYYLRDSRIDSVLARFGTGATNVRWTLTDYQGSVRNVIDATGVSKTVIVYNGYGLITSETDPTERGRYVWQGREADLETQLRYNRARYYDPYTGRWISQDPLGFDAGDSNLYRYVNNRHTMATDPSGLDWRVVATQSWERAVYHTPKKYAHQTAKIQVTLWWDDAGERGKAKFMLTFDVYPGKDEKGAILAEMRKDGFPLDYAITEVSSNLREKHTQTYKGSEAGKVEERLVRESGGANYGKLKMGDYFRWQLPLGEAMLTDDSNLAGVAGMYCWTDLDRLAKGLDRNPDDRRPQKVAKPVVIAPVDAVVQKIEWSITLPKGAKNPSGKINLTETGWGRNDNQGEGLTTITLPTPKALQSWKDKGYYGPSEVLRPIDSPASRGTFPLREAIK